MSCFETFKNHGLKLTPQRRLIIGMLHEQNGHMTADGIISEVRSKMPGVNKSTIYRTLDLLEETGCAVKSQVSGHTVYHHADEGHHHHLACDRCGRTVECPEEVLSQVAGTLRDTYGFEADFKHLVVRGTCSTCAKNQQQRNQKEQ